MSRYRQGDVLQKLLKGPLSKQSLQAESIACDVGLATAAAIYRVEAEQTLEQRVTIPLLRINRAEPTTSMSRFPHHPRPTEWRKVLANTCELRVPDERMQFLFDAAKHYLVLHSPGEVYPGPYTYKRFWFRDAAFILNGMLALGFNDRVERCIARFPQHQTAAGFFHSQDGEWDSNGEAIWIIDRYRRLTDRPLPSPLVRAVMRGADWIERKRTSDNLEAVHAGLLPAGFSAEHLGPNDYYYWDDFWSIAGLQSASDIAQSAGESTRASSYRNTARKLEQAINRSLERSEAVRGQLCLPASPYRRLDSGAIGSIVCSYPLMLLDLDDARLRNTVDYLLDECIVAGGFFQDMIHSGINAYLTLHLAQVLLKSGDLRYWPLVEAVAALASPTGQWPEAIHPRTKGGCMGDGQHIWAAAEWVLMMRALFVEEHADRLIIGKGLPDEWLTAGNQLRFGPTPTPFGPVQIDIHCHADFIHVDCSGVWHRDAPEIEIAIPGLRVSSYSNQPIDLPRQQALTLHLGELR